MNQENIFFLIGGKNSGKASLINAVKHKKAETAKFIPIDSDHTDESQFKQCIKQYKRDGVFKRLSGVLLILDITQVNIDHITNHISEHDIRINQVEKIITQLTQFKKTIPLYLILTKCDILAGFKEFFSELTVEDRDQALGITFDSTLPRIHLKAFLITKYKAFLQNLYNQLIWRLHHEHNPEKRLHIKDFPLQLESLQTIIIETAIKLNANKTPLAGIYFTSSIQTGKSIDHLMDPLIKFPLIKSLSIDKQLIQVGIQKQAPYFISDVFHKLLFVRQKSSKTQAKHKSIQPGYYIATGVIAAIIFGMGLYGYISGTKTIDVVKSVLAENLSNSNNRYAYVPKLMTLEHAENILISRDHVLQFGFTQITKLHKAINKSFHKTLATQFIPNLQHIIEKSLTDKRNNPEVLYNSLKVYLMLGNPKRLDSQFVVNYFQRYWQQILPKHTDTQKELVSILQTLLQHDDLALNLNQHLVNQTRQALNNLPLPQLTFAIMADNHSNKTINILAKIKTDVFIKRKYTIPEIYTAKIFPTVYKTEINNAAKNMAAGNWVLGTKSQNYVPQQAIDFLTEAVQEIYLDKYASIWQALLQQITLKPFKNLQQASRVLTELTNKDSPILQLLNVVNNNTKSNSLIPAFNKTVSKQFTVINQIAINPNQDKALLALQQVQLYISQLANSPNSEKAAFRQAEKRMQNGGEMDTIGKLSQFAETEPTPLRSWLNQLANNSWRVILKSARIYINKAWANTILPQYDNFIANRYPFFKNAKKQVSLAQFTSFFGPNGAMDRFFNEYLKAFVDTSHLYWNWKSLNGEHLNIEQPKLEMFIRAGLIKQMFFPGDFARPKVEFLLRPGNISTNIKDALFDLDGRRSDYQTTKKELSFTWPGPQPSFARIQFTKNSGQSIDKTTTGPWALFKLLDFANLQNTTNAKHYQINFKLENYSAKYELVANNLVNAFIPGIIDAFRCPEKL